MGKNFDEVYEIRLPKRNPETGAIELTAKDEPVMELVKIYRGKRLDRDRTFTIGGETFTTKASVAPEAVMRWSAMTSGEFVEKDEDGKVIKDEEGTPISTLSEQEALAIFDDTVLAFLEPGQEDKWKQVRSPDVPVPINLTDLQALVEWMFAEQSGRPTSPPSGSSNGSESGGTGTSLTAESSSQEAKV